MINKTKKFQKCVFFYSGKQWISGHEKNTIGLLKMLGTGSRLSFTLPFFQKTDALYSDLFSSLFNILNFFQNALFGEGTYLSAELSVCLNYAPTGKAWDKSLLGQKLSCVAVCEIIDDPSVKCQLKGQFV